MHSLRLVMRLLLVVSFPWMTSGIHASESADKKSADQDCSRSVMADALLQDGGRRPTVEEVSGAVRRCKLQKMADQSRNSCGRGVIRMKIWNRTGREPQEDEIRRGVDECETASKFREQVIEGAVTSPAGEDSDKDENLDGDTVKQAGSVLELMEDVGKDLLLEKRNADWDDGPITLPESRRGSVERGGR